MRCHVISRAPIARLPLPRYSGRILSLVLKSKTTTIITAQQLASPVALPGSVGLSSLAEA
jgi:hypothetical protein